MTKIETKKHENIDHVGKFVLWSLSFGKYLTDDERKMITESLLIDELFSVFFNIDDLTVDMLLDRRTQYMNSNYVRLKKEIDVIDFLLSNYF
jgi:hypothetical protein